MNSRFRIGLSCGLRLIAVVAWLWLVPGLLAQVDTVTLRVQPRRIGLGGQVQPGVWTPLQLELVNHAAEARRVRCQWILTDTDNDTVHAQRVVTLTPQQPQRVWLYAVPPIHTDAHTAWRVSLIDEASGQLLATQPISPGKLLAPRVGVVGLTGSMPLGLAPYSPDATQHEAILFLRDLDWRSIPDRWYGLSMMQTLVWTTSQNESTPGATIPGATIRAVRQWVQRGGHLVVVYPTVGQPFAEAPPMQDLLPSVTVARLDQVPPPKWLGRPSVRSKLEIDVKVLQPREEGAEPVSVILRDSQGRSLVVARRFGMGRVTLIGVDLTDPRLVQLGLPNGTAMWKAILNWQSPAYSREKLERDVKAGKMNSSRTREHFALDRFIPGLIAMRETATPAMLGAIVVFGLYWLIAGPLGFAVMKRRHQTRHSWMFFVGVVIIFSLVTWGGAVMMRPHQAGIEHFTVLDVDARSGLARARSWLSVFVPKQERVRVSLASPTGDRFDHTLASPGNDVRAEETGFIDSQRYTLEAGSPDELYLPIRATAKQLTIDYMGARSSPSQPVDWGLTRDRQVDPQGRPRLSVTHQLPGPLRNVRLIYCLGGGETPRIWMHPGPWKPNEPLDAMPRPQAEPLVRQYRYVPVPNPTTGKTNQERQLKNEGYLGKLIAAKTGQDSTFAPTGSLTATNMAPNEIVQAIELLSFFSMLPPPDYRDMSHFPSPFNYDRPLTRSLDLTALSSMPCVIVMGHLENGSIPIPIQVDSQVVPSSGWTVVRWICPMN